ncbi:MAG: DsbA family protein [Nocardioides sp.]|nr:DsbA family protein [Nocardioides sp.]
MDGANTTSDESLPDVRFWFDPMCPFAWMTSKWVRMVQEQRDYTVEWRFISLRLLNKHIDYDAHFPPDYDAGHTAGLQMLRVCSRVLEAHGQERVAQLYPALSSQIFDVAPEDANDIPGRVRDLIETALTRVGLSPDLARFLDDESRDQEIQLSTDEALALTGKDVGTPILHVAPPDGAAFFGPVISRLPTGDEAAELWDHVVGLATFQGFSELKRSLRERPQLRALGVTEDQAGVQEDWHAGSRRQKK